MMVNDDQWLIIDNHLVECDDDEYEWFMMVNKRLINNCDYSLVNDDGY